jgi:hypothetical protein
LTAICDPLTNTCGCNSNTNFPCGDGEACLIDPVEGRVCKDPEGEVGDGSLDSDCLVDGDCLTGECYYGFQPPGTLGTCTCNALTNAGCSGNFECFSSVDLQEMMGIADAPPECLLPFGAPCDSQADIGSSCVTGNCAKVTNQCTCNELTNYPCDVENGETCVIDAEGSFACLGAEVECPVPSEGTPCTLEENPVVCPGECEYPNQCVATSADPTFTNETCSLVNSVCPMPSGETPCTADENPVVCPGECEYPNQCVATSADPSFTNETCSLVNPVCPVPSEGTPCTLEYNPVVCPGECEYANQCIATSADPSFTNVTCVCCNDPEGEVGDGSLDSDCLVDGDCLTGECYYGFQPPDTLGTCTCNALTNAGCSGNFECFSSVDLQEMMGIADAPPDCLLPFGAPCDSQADIGSSCVTGNCAKVTNQCTCNELTNYPCDVENGETCVIDAEGSFACLGAEVECPVPSEGTPCTLEENPVVCPGECEYPNQCVATSADPTFTNETCSLVNSVCPMPSGETPCTADENPVVCPGECEYPNQCVATSADPSFTNETCSLVNPVCPVPSEGTPCTLEYNPVVCPGECEYANQCIATSADPSFTNVTCALVNPVCPVPSEETPCTLEENPVVCPGECEYANQCVATSADPSFTNETCSLVNSGCPVPSGGTPCTTDENPVVCPGECEYANQCVATSADPSFTNETCSLVNMCPVDVTGTSICTLEYLPVNCFGCEYANQCLATSADASFTNETCTLVESVCPVSTGICTLEYAPVNCSGCEYSNQCKATDANPEFTPETCTPVPNP